MQFSISSVRTQCIFPLLSSLQANKEHRSQLNFPRNVPRKGLKMSLKVECGGKGNKLVMQLEKELEEIQKEGKEWRAMQNCKGSTSMEGRLVELLECLEREAIMGDDEGREPNDYNRRAQIFDKSSRVFQALKELRSKIEA